MMQKIKKPVSILLSLIMVFSMFAIVPITAYATDYTTLTVGDVLHVGDTINDSQTTYRYASGCTWTTVGRPYTLARGDINLSTGNFTESDNGGYYFFKNGRGKIEYDPDFQSDYMNKIVFAATSISDGLYVKSVGNLSFGARDISFAVH